MSRLQKSRRTSIVLLVLTCFGPGALLPAQPVSTGTVTGRVFNASTGEYVRNAEVNIQGTNRTVTSGDGGYFEITNIPPGQVIVAVNYAGYETSPATVEVSPGQTVTHDFELRSTILGEVRRMDETVQMEEFVVMSDREGNAKALMDERNSMTLGTSVAADAFGDTTEGNVGEFLKYLPGLEVEYVGSTARNVRIGGLDPEYTGVAIDGNSLASADAAQQYNTTENTVAVGQGVRSFGFEQTSINNIESVEILRIPGADKSADSPAGVVNLKTKRAFDRKGRRIDWSLGGSLHSEEFHLKKTVGPHDGRSYKIHPNFSLDYSDVFMNKRLGILVGVSGSRFFTAQKLNLQRIQRTPSTADPRPQVVTAIVLSNTPKTTERFTTSLTADFKATPQLTLSLTASYNAYDARTYPRELTFQAATNNTNGTTGRRFVGGDGLTTISTGGATAAARSVGLGAVGNAIKLTNSVSIVPKFEFRTRRIVVDGTLAYSRSKNTFAAIDRGTFKTAEVFPLQNVGFTATRPDALSPAWTIQQTSGLDWADLANYRSNVVSGEHRFGFNEVYDGALNFRYNLPLKNPTFIKVGTKVQEKNSRYQGRGILEKWGYIGPGAGTYADYPSSVMLDFDAFGASINSIDGNGVPTFPSRDALGALFHSNPEYFERRLVTAENHYSANYVRNTKFKETIPAAYLQANTRVGRWQFQGGLRWEKTTTRSREPDPLRASEVRAAGFPVNNSTQRASTIEGIDYQFGSRPRIERKGEYENWFPSVAAKFRLSERFNIDFGYGRAISRPPINQLSGIWTYSEDPDDPTAGTIRVPNPNLKPEKSTKFVAGLSYFFGSVGSLSLSLTQNDIKNLRISEDFTAEEFGITDPAFQNYTVVSTRSGAGSRRFRSMDIHYRQQLTFLPRVLRGAGVFAGYTRTYSDLRRNGISPHKITGGVSYGYHRISGRVNGVWLDDAPWTNTVGRYRRQNLKIDVNASYRLNDKISIFANGRNIFNAPHEVIDGPPLGTPILFRYEDFGVAWNFGVRGAF